MNILQRDMKKWHYPFLAFLIIGTIIILSQSKPAKPEYRTAQGLVFGTSTPEQKAATRASWNHWDVIHTVIILSFTVAFYIYFW